MKICSAGPANAFPQTPPLPNKGTIILSWFNLGLTILVTFAAIIWWNGARARELALAHARRACKQAQVQLLDQTVALQRVAVSRNGGGNLCLERQYRFEYTQQGTYRDNGTVSMWGHELRGVSLPYARDEDGNRVFLQ